MKCVYCVMKQRRRAAVPNALSLTLESQDGKVAASVLVPRCEAHVGIAVFVDSVDGEEVASEYALLEDAAPLFQSLVSEPDDNTTIIEELRAELTRKQNRIAELSRKLTEVDLQLDAVVRRGSR